MRILGYYRRLLRKYPYTVQSVQTGALLGIGDALSQTLEEIKPYNKWRTVRFASMGAFMGPVILVWYKFLDKKIHKGVEWKKGMVKVFFDQLVFAPISLVIFISVVSLMEGMHPQQIQAKLNSHYFPILLANYKVNKGQVNQFVPLQVLQGSRAGSTHGHRRLSHNTVNRFGCHLITFRHSQ